MNKLPPDHVGIVAELVYQILSRYTGRFAEMEVEESK